MEGTRPNAYDYGGHPAPIGASPTRPYKCGQYFKIKINIKILSRRGDPRGRPFLILTLNILTAFIRLGRAGPVGAGCPPYYYYLTLLAPAVCENVF